MKTKNRQILLIAATPRMDSLAKSGIRVPFLIRWPDKVPAGRESNEIVHGVDMFATPLHRSE
jgi:arylsulfatase A-like enzyme